MAAFVTLLFALPLGMWEAWVTVVLWRWFVTPAFGVDAPAFWHVVGLLVLLGMLKAKASDATREDLEGDDPFPHVRAILFGAIAPAVALGWGFIVHLIAA